MDEPLSAGAASAAQGDGRAEDQDQTYPFSYIPSPFQQSLHDVGYAVTPGLRDQAIDHRPYDQPSQDGEKDDEVRAGKERQEKPEEELMGELHHLPEEDSSQTSADAHYDGQQVQIDPSVAIGELQKQTLLMPIGTRD
jgi:hypothetical protein